MSRAWRWGPLLTCALVNPLPAQTATDSILHANAVVQARVTTGQAAGFAGNLAVAALPGGIGSGAQGTMLPVQYGGLSLHNASQATAFLAYARTVAGTSLDHLAHHPVLASRAYS